MPIDSKAPLMTSNQQMRPLSLWSFLRAVLSQGGDIWIDHQQKSYEQYSARLDAAARERADELERALSGTPAVETRASERDAQLDELAKLPHGWDSYSGIPPLGNCLAKARQLAALLPAGHWDIVPGSDGSVQIEQHQGGLDIELHISSAQNGPAESGKP